MRMAAAVDDDSGPLGAERTRVESSEISDLLVCAAKLLFINGQTTERTLASVARLAAALECRVTVLPHWDGLTFQIDHDGRSRWAIVAAAPVGVDMHKVAAGMGVIDDICEGRMSAAAARHDLETIGKLPPASTARFAVMAAAGAAALGVIFGAAHISSLVLIALSAGLGACLRRWLGRISFNTFIQPFSAALLAGAVGALVVHLNLSSQQRLVAVCPCMVLVPGPHLLNGAIDLARARVALGAARTAFAGLIILTICAGLLLGLALGNTGLLVSSTSPPVPFAYDVIAAGVAVAAYGTFFSMPWRMLPIPILIGMAAHAVRWLIIVIAGANVEIGALCACLLASTLVTPIANRLRLPFAAFAFASVVSLIPGVLLFRMAGGLVESATLGGNAGTDLLLGGLNDGLTALLILLAMTFGLLFPKMCIQHVIDRRHRGAGK